MPVDPSLLIYGLLIGIGAGLLGGILAGLAGVGGGLIYVPLFYALMPGGGEGMSIHIFASLVAVVITGFFSSRAHIKLGHVDIHALKRLLPGLIMGAGLGLWVTLRLPEIWILLSLAALNAWVAYDYGRNVTHHTRPGMSPGLFSGPVGFASGLLGIGGGTMLVPLLRRFVALRHAVGTSAVCGMVMALGAVALNSALEPDWASRLSDQYIVLIAVWSGVLLALPLTSGWSARMHERLDEHILRLILKSIFAAISTSMLIAALLS